MREWINLVENEQRIDELKKYTGSNEVEEFLSRLHHSDTNRIFTNKKIMSKFGAYLKQKGYIVFGNGCYGITFSHPTLNYVLKMFIDDPSYMAYVRYCLANQNNPHVPKFRGKFMKLDENCYVVRMEKLQKLRGHVADMIVNTLHAYGETPKWSHDPEGYIEYLRRNTWQGGQGRFAHKAYDELDPSMKSQQLDMFSDAVDFDLLTTIDDIRDIATNVGAKFDLHINNAMKRGDTIVITDPFVDIYDIKNRR